MSNIKKIKAEIEKRRKDIKAYCLNPNHDKRYDVVPEQLAYILSFIDSLPEEKLSYVTDSPGDPGNPGEPGISDLEEAAKKYAHCPFTDDDGNFHEDAIDETAYRDFIAGAEWQKMEAGRGYDSRDLYEAYEQGRFEQREQMMKDAVEGEIGYWNQRGLSIRLDQSLEKIGYDEDTKVKIIIVKQ